MCMYWNTLADTKIVWKTLNKIDDNSTSYENFQWNSEETFSFEQLESDAVGGPLGWLATSCQAAVPHRARTRTQPTAGSCWGSGDGVWSWWKTWPSFSKNHWSGSLNWRFLDSFVRLRDVQMEKHNFFRLSINQEPTLTRVWVDVWTLKHRFRVQSQFRFLWWQFSLFNKVVVKGNLLVRTLCVSHCFFLLDRFSEFATPQNWYVFYIAVCPKQCPKLRNSTLITAITAGGLRWS